MTISILVNQRLQSRVTSRNIAMVNVIALEFAQLTGMYSNTTWMARHFPKLQRFPGWFKILFITIPFIHIRDFAPLLLQRSRKPLRDTQRPAAADVNLNPTNKSAFTTVLDWMICTRTSGQGPLKVADFATMSCVLLGLIFASVHQIWVTCQTIIQDGDELALASSERYHASMTVLGLECRDTARLTTYDLRGLLYVE